MKDLEKNNLSLKTSVVYQAKGCEKCSYIGYHGRTVIVEAILVDDKIRELIYQGAQAPEIMEMAKKNGALSLFESGLRRVEEGITSLEEVMAVAAI